MVFTKLASLAVLATLAACEPPAGPSGYNYRAPQNNYLPPATGFSGASNRYIPPSGASYDQGHGHGSQGHGGQGHGGQGHGSHGHGHDNEVPKSYEFGYAVKDAQSGNDYDRHESSDGNVVRGEYRVALPDGRTQIVKYHADWKTGFHADVRYEGEARYPEPSRNVHQQGGYNYNAPSDFSGSLTGFHGNQGFKQPSQVYGPSGYH